MADGGTRGKFGPVFKVEWLLTSIIAGGMAVFIAIRLFDEPLWLAAPVGSAVTLADIAILAWLEWNPSVKRIDRK